MHASETLRVIHLGSDHQVLTVSTYPGQARKVDVPVRAIVADALPFDTSAVVLSHTHPQGDPTPSADDRIATARLAEVLKAIDVDLYDHVVIGDGRRVSFREAGLL